MTALEIAKLLEFDPRDTDDIAAAAMLRKQDAQLATMAEALTKANRRIEQLEPVGWVDPSKLAVLTEDAENLLGVTLAGRKRSENMIPLYTASPAQTPAQGRRFITYACPVCAASLEVQE